MSVFAYVNGQSIEVFDAPFYQQVRDLANGCFANYERNHGGRELNWDTSDGDMHARTLLRQAIARELKAAEPDWAAELLAIQRAEQPRGPLAFLYELAWDGGGQRPKGALFGWDIGIEPTGPRPIADIVAPIVERVRGEAT